jgi:predicted DNA-binding transcriptional regulator AlpA
MTHYTLPATGFLRLYQIIGAPKADPPVPAIIPVSKSAWYEGIQKGTYPRPLRLGANSRTSLWRVEDILALVGAGYDKAE